MMKLNEIARQPDGVYAGVRFSQDTVNTVREYLDKHDIVNPVNTNDLHTTLLYSRRFDPTYQAKEMYNPTMKGTPNGFEIWPQRNGEERNILVLTFDAPDLSARHESLMNSHDLTYDFDEYKPHITFSYDAGNVNPDILPAYVGDIEIIGEYQEDLDL